MVGELNDAIPALAPGPDLGPARSLTTALETS
jgi:hypothetical protein